MESKFTGTLLGSIGITIAVFAIVFFTFGLGTPWALVIKERWIADNTYIEGHHLYFTGTGAGLFGNWIKWFLLTIITLGIYSFWLGIKVKQWQVSNTHIVKNDYSAV